MGIVGNFVIVKVLLLVINVDLILLDIYLFDGNGFDLFNELCCEEMKSEVMLLIVVKEVEIFEKVM